jgi:hypothetical protein
VPHLHVCVSSQSATVNPPPVGPGSKAGALAFWGLLAPAADVLLPLATACTAVGLAAAGPHAAAGGTSHQANGGRGEAASDGVTATSASGSLSPPLAVTPAQAPAAPKSTGSGLVWQRSVLLVCGACLVLHTCFSGAVLAGVLGGKLTGGDEHSYGCKRAVVYALAFAPGPSECHSGYASCMACISHIFKLKACRVPAGYLFLSGNDAECMMLLVLASNRR